MAKRCIFDEPKEKKKRDDQPKAAGQKWTSDEEQRLRTYHSLGLSFEEIAANHQRTVLAIQIRLGKLGLIQFEYDKDAMKN